MLLRRKYVISGHGPRELQYLSLTSIYITAKQLLELLSCSCATLRELSLNHVTLDSGDTWEPTIRVLKSRFHGLNSISVFCLVERALEKHTNIWFPTLADYPKVSRTERRDSPRSDCRLLQSGDLPVKLNYKKRCKEVMVAGVRYHGSNMGVFLDILVQSIERDRRRG